MIIFKTHEIFKYLQELLPTNSIIVEAGAFHGHDTIKLANSFPHGFMHAFEPVPELFMLLLEKTKDYQNIHCYEYALSNKTGTAEFYLSEKPNKQTISQAGSLHKPKERLKHSPLTFPKTTQVLTITLDTWAIRHAIQKVDCLWLDMQGHELAVLQASTLILPSVKVIYTEVSFIESYESIPQYEQVKFWLEQQGFTEFGHTFTNQTDWFFGNCLFVRK